MNFVQALEDVPNNATTEPQNISKISEMKCENDTANDKASIFNATKKARKSVFAGIDPNTNQQAKEGASQVTDENENDDNSDDDQDGENLPEVRKQNVITFKLQIHCSELFSFSFTIMLIIYFHNY